MNKFLFSFLVICFLPGKTLIASSDISLTEVSPEGGVAITSVMCINEDHLGFIWFGTNNGLFRYNTFDIKRYSYSQSDDKTIATNRINQILNDSKDQLFIASENGICKYNQVDDNFIRLEIKDKANHLIGTDITSLVQTSDNEYWMLDEKGIAKLNLELNRADYTIFENNSRARLLHKDSMGNLWVVFQDGSIYYKTLEAPHFEFFSTAIVGYPRTLLVNNKQIWIGYDKSGLMCFDFEGNLLHHYTTQNNFLSDRIRSIIKAADGNLWVGTYNGIAILDGLEFIKTINSKNNPNLPNQSVWSLHKDKNDIIWIGTWLGGLAYYSQFTKAVFHNKQLASKDSNNQYVVTSFAQDPDGNHVWIGTESGDLSNFNLLTHVRKEVELLYNNKKIKNIRTLAFDKYERLWVGTRGNGILYKEKHETNFRQLKTPFSSGLQILSLLPVEDGIWVSNYQQGVFYYSFTDKSFKQYQNNPLNINSISDKHVWKIIQDSKGNLWFATQNGLNCLKKGSSSFIRYFHTKNNPASLSEDYNYCIHEDRNGNIWIGTNGSGLDKLNPATSKFEHYTTHEGLPGNDIYSIVEDQNGNLWLATDNGICKFNPNKIEFTTFGNINGIYNNKFNPNAALYSNKNIMFFGGSNGFVYFKPNDILTQNNIDAKSVLTNFYINNEAILPGQENDILKSNISSTQSIRLNHTQNSFSFKFVATNYINPDKNTFKYHLLGFDDKWIETGIYSSAVYTKIPPGKYKFQVKAANNDGLWSSHSTSVDITIIPPIWARWYAYVCYFLLILGILLYFRYETIKRHKLKSQIELEQIKRESEENLNQVKLQFFTNISHEFRTPLTLILGPVNRLISNTKLDSAIQPQLSLIRSNSERLLRLINQILDFRKIESGKLNLKAVNSDIISFSKNVFHCFSEHARHRSFTYTFKADYQQFNIDFDPDKLDIVIFNILSNAFKYCPDKGNIELKVSHNIDQKTADFYEGEYSFGNTELNEYIEITVTDNGLGVDKEKLPMIFERFYQTNNADVSGSGIGLALTKDYVNIHNGSLSIASTSKKGTRVSIKLPTKQKSTINKKITSTKKTTIVEKVSVNMNETEEMFDMKHQDSLILIVEDNSDLLNYLSKFLEANFKVAKAKNGIEGLEQVRSLFPDLIISDIMMPEMDGIEFCEQIKNDIQTSHIPVILLTALETVKDRISGLKSGADAYLSKPFDDTLLQTQIINLLDSRKNLRESFSDMSDSWDTKAGSMDIDKKLILKATQIVESNLSNIDLSVDMLASELHLSRTTLHRKLKSLTNQSATEFIRYIRLKNAVKLLQAGNLKVNEIGFTVGFNSHNYFTTSFKNQYGISPSEYIKKNSLES